MSDDLVRVVILVITVFLTGVVIGGIKRQPRPTAPLNKDEMDLAVTSVIPRIQALEWLANRPREDRSAEWIEAIARVYVETNGYEISDAGHRWYGTGDTTTFYRAVVRKRLTTASVPSDAAAPTEPAA